MIRSIEKVFERIFLASGGIVLLFFNALAQTRYLVRNLDKLLRQMFDVGVITFPLASLIGLFTGMIVALESGIELKEMALETVVPSIVALSMMREMGPVITAMISSGRAGSAMAAELGTMTVNEEVDALRALGINPVRFLVMPRLLATIIVQPILTVYAVLIGIWGGSVVSDSLLGIPRDWFMHRIYTTLDFSDIVFGLSKTVVFGAIYSVISCYMGLNAKRGAEDVGRATTRAVVASLTMILIADYFVGRFFG